MKQISKVQPLLQLTNGLLNLIVLNMTDISLVKKCLSLHFDRRTPDGFGRFFSKDTLKSMGMSLFVGGW